MTTVKCLLSFAFCLVAVAFAESPQELFQKGNAAYAQGQFDQAAAAYESARAQGARSWVLEYDLGNADYKAGRIGQAVACYLRAFHLNSHQGDVIYNLNFALTKAGDPLLPAGALPRLLWRLFFIFSLNTLTVLVSLLFIGICVLSGLFLLTWKPEGMIAESGAAARRRWKWPLSAEGSVGILAALLVLGLWLGLRIAYASRHEAVVIVPEAEVRGGPNMSYTANFTVPEGHRVLVLDEQEPIQGWLEIGVPDQGLKGWVPDASVEII